MFFSLFERGPSSALPFHSFVGFLSFPYKQPLRRGLALIRQGGCATFLRFLFLQLQRAKLLSLDFPSPLPCPGDPVDSSMVGCTRRSYPPSSCSGRDQVDGSPLFSSFRKIERFFSFSVYGNRFLSQSFLRLHRSPRCPTFFFSFFTGKPLSHRSGSPSLVKVWVGSSPLFRLRLVTFVYPFLGFSRPQDPS